MHANLCQILGDALVAVAFVRNALSMSIVFALTPWINALGYRNMFLSAGFFALGFNLLVVPMIIYGKRLRVMCAKRYGELAKMQFDPKGI